MQFLALRCKQSSSGLLIIIIEPGLRLIDFLALQIACIFLPRPRFIKNTANRRPVCKSPQIHLIF
jgi:hypothetical protein